MKNKYGFISLEAVFALTFLFMVFFFILSIIAYIIPLVTMPTYLHILSNNIRVQGGMTSENVEDFKDAIESNYGYISSNDLRDVIAVEAISIPSNIDVSNIDISTESTEYISRNDKEVILITANVPSNRILPGILSYFNSSISEYYSFTHVVSSERF